MTRNRLTTAGWLAMASAALTVPWIVLTFSLAGGVGEGVKAAEICLLVSGTALLVYLLLTLRRLLQEKFSFRAADGIMALLIKVNIVSAAVSVFGFAVPSLEGSVGVFGIVMVVLIGILQGMFGFRLLSLPADLQGLHKPYCYLNIVTGVCTAVVVLLPLGVVASAVSDVMLGTIFFQAAAALPRAEEGP